MKTAQEWNWEHAKICHNDPAVHGQLLPGPQMVRFLKRVQADALRHAATLVIGNATENGLATIRLLERVADRLAAAIAAAQPESAFYCPRGYGECQDARACIYPGRCGRTDRVVESEHAWRMGL